LNAEAVAVIVAVPEPTAATSPAVVTLATEGLLEAQINPVVIGCVVGCFALP
jgi:hypothetical protein